MPVDTRPGIRRPLGLLISPLIVLLCLAPVSAHAESTTSSSAETIANALRESPVYVDPVYSTVLSEETREEAVATIEESGLPVRVVLTPLLSGDDWDGDASALAAAVHDRMGGAGHYLVLEGDSFQGQDLPPSVDGSSELRAHYAALASSYATEFDGTVGERMERAVEFAVSDDPEAVYEEYVSAYEDSRVAAPGPPSGNADGATVWPWALGTGALLILLVGGYLLWTRRPTAPSMPQHAAFANASQARRESLERQAERELIEVGERLGAMEPATGTDASLSLGRALDAHDAARRVAEHLEEGSLADVVGVLVLLDLAEDGLAAAGRGRRWSGADRRRHCYANPLHGTGTTDTDWRQLGATRSVRVPLCGGCAKAVRARTRPAALQVEHEGRSVPYYEVPAEESVWAATGFGSLSDDLVERILRGERSGRR
ncbi:hypothetical protein VSQ78_05985 [Nocardiopsis alba]|uniref:DUF4350 domain-containing protein n=1 Tax=Nocardiopsis alba TaxID=53437 RepID=A0ABV5DRM8_9ACTN